MTQFWCGFLGMHHGHLTGHSRSVNFYCNNRSTQEAQWECCWCLKKRWVVSSCGDPWNSW